MIAIPWNDGLANALVGAAPLLFAVMGETITERAGILNLSLNGLVILAAMGGFVVASVTGSLLAGFAAGAGIGAMVSLVVAFSSITLRQSQVAVGFVLALLCRDLAYFLGAPWINQPGPMVPAWPIPGLHGLPVVGPMFFSSDALTYASFLLVALAWWWIYHTRPGILLQAVGHQPLAAFARGVSVARVRYAYVILGGAIVGLAGPAYSLSIKPGWRGPISGLDGMGWIALAIVIFGAWHPLRGALGVYLFVLLQWLGVLLQPLLPQVPAQVLQVAPFPIMIMALLLMGLGDAAWFQTLLAMLPQRPRHALMRLWLRLKGTPPAALGRPFEPA